MELNMRVHRIGMTSAPMQVEIAGEATSVMVPRMEVELVSVEGDHGTVTLRFTRPSEIAWAKEKFLTDDVVPFSL